MFFFAFCHKLVFYGYCATMPGDLVAIDDIDVKITKPASTKTTAKQKTKTTTTLLANRPTPAFETTTTSIADYNTSGTMEFTTEEETTPTEEATMEQSISTSAETTEDSTTMSDTTTDNTTEKTDEATTIANSCPNEPTTIGTTFICSQPNGMFMYEACSDNYWECRDCTPILQVSYYICN